MEERHNFVNNIYADAFSDYKLESSKSNKADEVCEQTLHLTDFRENINIVKKITDFLVHSTFKQQ